VSVFLGLLYATSESRCSGSIDDNDDMYYY
jgi:hypothetical protein